MIFLVDTNKNFRKSEIIVLSLAPALMFYLYSLAIIEIAQFL